ncbi:MAG: hypothetical protein ACAI35_27220 [Candidatus Methylacidiphilales bacterium]|nr:hypothetical protein [Candidatus Methylacidiphilales bacterium]
MMDDQNYKKFVAQFSAEEWTLLCQHRLFLYYIKCDLKAAAGVAADTLRRTIGYEFAPDLPRPQKPQPKPHIQQQNNPSLPAPSADQDDISSAGSNSERNDANGKQKFKPIIEGTSAAKCAKLPDPLRRRYKM